MTEIQQNRWDRLIRRAAGIVGGGSQVNDTLNELFPTFDVENMPAEMLALSGTRAAFGGGLLAAAAAEGPTIQIFNPAGSAMLMTVTRGILSHDVADTTVRWGITGSPITTRIDTQVFRDTRFGFDATALPAGQIRTRSAAALANAAGQIRTLANEPLELWDENGLAVLVPGTGFEMGVSAAQSTIRVTFYWRERVAEPSELNL